MATQQEYDDILSYKTAAAGTGKKYRDGQKLRTWFVATSATTGTTTTVWGSMKRVTYPTAGTASHAKHKTRERDYDPSPLVLNSIKQY